MGRAGLARQNQAVESQAMESLENETSLFRAEIERKQKELWAIIESKGRFYYLRAIIESKDKEEFCYGMD